MSPSSRRTRPAAALALATLCALAGPAAAHAANAPLRFIGIGTDGKRTDQLRPTAVSNDGTEVLGAFGPYDVIRDVQSGVTHDILQPFDELRGASADLKRIVFTTRRSLVPADTNDAYDLYLWDRPSNTYALVSKDRAGASVITSITQRVEQVAISNLGTAVQFSVRDLDDQADPQIIPIYRYEASRSTTQKLGDVAGFTAGALSIGDNGTSLLVGDQVIAPTRTTTLASRPQNPVVTSPNGRFVAWQNYDGDAANGIDTTNGATASLAYPSILRDHGAWLAGIADDASTITLGATESFRRYAFGHVDRRGGLRQIGGDIPITELTSGSGAVLSRNEQFAVTPLVLAKLGSTPLPGTEPTAPSTALAFDYLAVNDFVCPRGSTGTPTKPTLGLSAYAQRSDLRLPVRATAKVWKDGSPTISNDMALSPGQTKELWVGLKGGYRIDATVTLADGTVLSGTKHLDSHDQWTCTGL
ncbi:MAG: hypothetical protein AAGC46_06915 [Solirubrobacteraceae bacterium]|nr:hypothetical protein [Patulibacter sp.]